MTIRQNSPYFTFPVLAAIALLALAPATAQAQYRMPPGPAIGLGYGPSAGQDNCPGFNRAVERAALRDRLRMPAAEAPHGILRSRKADGAADAGCTGKPANAAGAEKARGADPSAFSNGL